MLCRSALCESGVKNTLQLFRARRVACVVSLSHFEHTHNAFKLMKLFHVDQQGHVYFVSLINRLFVRSSQSRTEPLEYQKQK